MNFDYTEEFDNYFLVIFKIDNIPFSVIVDKETHDVVDVSTLTNGIYNSSHPYDKDTSLKSIDWLPVNYFEIVDVIKEYFDKTY